MSLENKIETLTKAITELTLKLENLTTLVASPAMTVAKVIEAPPVVAPVVETPAPVVPVAAPAAPVMPPPPTFMADPVPTAVPTVPFSDGKGLIAYVMDSYKALGALKGAQVGTVLQNLGYENIHDVKPEHYAALFAAIEALKV